MAETYQERSERLEQMRTEALASRNAPLYAALCNELGTQDIEDSDLIDQAQADALVRANPSILEVKLREKIKAPKKRRKNAADPAKYQRFLDDAEVLYSPGESFENDADTKRKTIIKHFPGRYSHQRMDSYEDAKLGATFNHIVESAREIVDRPNSF